MVAGRPTRRARSLSLSAGLNIDGRFMTPGSRVDPRQLSARNNSFSLGQDGGRTTHAALSVVGARQDGPPTSTAEPRRDL